MIAWHQSKSDKKNIGIYIKGRNFITMTANLSKYPESKSEYLFTIAKVLAMDVGAFKDYTAGQVKQAHQKSVYNKYNCLHWAVSVYSSKTEFDKMFPERKGDYDMLREELIGDAKSSMNNNSDHWVWLEIGSELLGFFF